MIPQDFGFRNWIHVAITLEVDDTMTCMVNGDIINDVNTQAHSVDVNRGADFLFGSFAAQSIFFIDDFMYYDAAIPIESLKKIYEESKCFNQSRVNCFSLFTSRSPTEIGSSVGEVFILKSKRTNNCSPPISPYITVW